MEMQKLNIDGINIAFVRQGTGIPLILIHGYPLDHSIWDPVAALLENDFEMIMPDLRGFGNSEPMEADRSMLAYASDIAGLLERLRLRKVHMVGHSMGGYVALAFARAFSERIAGFGLVASQVLADTPERKEARYATAREVLATGVATVVEAMTPKLSSDKDTQSFVRDLMSRQQAAGLACALQAMAERADSTEILTNLRCPVVIVHGQADALIPVEQGRAMRTALPSAHYVELEAAGHMPMLEDPAAVAKALRWFLEARDRAVKLTDG
jgi:pimeloyl-ACP methyl ester carboxylesterase